MSAYTKKGAAMSTVSIRSTKPDRKAPTPQQRPARATTQKPHPLPVLSGDDQHILTAKQAYELYSARGYQHGSALDDWLEAEREILRQIPPV